MSATIQRTDLAFPISVQVQNGTIVAAQPVMERIQRVGQSGSEAQQTAIGGNVSRVSFTALTGDIAERDDAVEYLTELSGYFADINDDFGRDWTVYVQSCDVSLSSGQYSHAGVTYQYRITADMVLEAQP